MTPLLAIQNLTVRYDGRTPALKNASLVLHEGERLGIVGESGSGKSTLALAISGLLARGTGISGAIHWQDGATAPKKGTDIGFVFQDPAGSLDPLMRVGNQIAEVVRVLHHTPRADAQNAALDLLRRVGFANVDEIARRYPHQLSGGQKQRIAIACALAGRPKLLIADEATSALDTIVQAEIVALLNGLVVESGLALLFITHDLPLASNLADRLVVMKGGEILESGTARQIIETPQNAYVRALVAANIALDGPRLLDQVSP